MRKSIWILAVIILIAGGWWLAKESKEEGETIKVGAALGLSGICAEFGEGELKAATLAVEEANKAGGVNGKQIELLSEDTLCESKGTVNATQKLVSVHKVAAIIGPTWGDTFQGGYPIARAANILSIGASSALESLAYTGEPNTLIFSTWFPQNREIDALQRYIAAQGLKTVSIIYDQDPFGTMMGMLFKDHAARNGLTIVDEKVSATNSTDFRTFIAQMKVKKPEAVFVSFVSPDHKAIFFKQAKELRFAVRYFASADTENPALLESFAAALEGVVYTFPKGARGYDAFAKKYEERFNEKPKVSSSHAYDAATILVTAMKNAGTKGDALERELLSIELPGVTYDTLKFSDKHQIAGGEFEIKTVRNGQFVTVGD